MPVASRYFEAVAQILPVIFLALFVEHAASAVPFARKHHADGETAREWERDLRSLQRELEAFKRDTPDATDRIKRREEMIHELAELHDRYQQSHDREAILLQAFQALIERRFLRVAIAVGAGEATCLYALGSGDRDVWLAAIAGGAVVTVVLEVVAAFLGRLDTQMDPV